MLSTENNLKRRRDMKKQMIIVIAVLAVIVVAVGIGVLVGNVGSSKLQTADEMKGMFDTIYANLGDALPSLETAEIDVSDSMMVEFYTGLKSNENVEVLVVSEPLTGSQAYSAVAVKVSDKADIEAMKQEMLDNIDTNKWICVSASKVYVTNHNNVIFLIMADSDWAKPVYDEFKKFVENNVGKELERDAEEEIELPPELIIAQ